MSQNSERFVTYVVEFVLFSKMFKPRESMIVFEATVREISQTKRQRAIEEAGERV